MTDAEVATINAFASLAFGLLVLASSVRMVERYIRHKALRRRAPLLLYRDLSLFLPVAVLMAGIYWQRVTGASWRNEWWWTIGSNVLLIFAMVVWTWFEYAVVGRHDDEGEEE